MEKVLARLGDDVYIVPMEKFHINFPLQLLNKLRKLATLRGISVAEIVRRAVDEYLSRPTK